LDHLTAATIHAASPLLRTIGMLRRQISHISYTRARLGGSVANARRHGTGGAIDIF
jgi:hypothetical protein